MLLVNQSVSGNNFVTLVFVVTALKELPLQHIPFSGNLEATLEQRTLEPHMLSL